MFSHNTPHYRCTTTPPQPFYHPFLGPPRWARARRKLLLDFMLPGRITRGRHTNNPGGCHSIWTNQHTKMKNQNDSFNQSDNSKLIHHIPSIKNINTTLSLYLTCLLQLLQGSLLRGLSKYGKECRMNKTESKQKVSYKQPLTISEATAAFLQHMTARLRNTGSWTWTQIASMQLTRLHTQPAHITAMLFCFLLAW